MSNTRTAPQGFLSLATFPSMLYLASAVSALIGVAQIIVPIHDKPKESLEIFRCLIALNGYELLLLAALMMIVLWKNVTDDAISLVVIVVCFLVGSAAAIDVVAPAEPFAAVCFGVAGTLLATGKLITLGSRIVGPWGGFRSVGLGILVAWNFSTPALLSYQLARQMEKAPDNFDRALIHLWNAGSLLLVLAAAIVLVGMNRTLPSAPAPAPERDPIDTDDVTPNTLEEPPFLRTDAMRWILLAVAVGASFFHAYSVSWSVGLNLNLSHVMVGLVAVLLIVIELRRIMGCKLGPADYLMASVPALALSISLLAEGCDAGCVSAWPSHPPIALLLMSFGLAASAWHPDRRSLLAAAGTNAAFALLTPLAPASSSCSSTSTG